MRISDSFCGDQKSILHCSFNKNSKDCFERDFLFLLLLLLSLWQSRWLKRTWVTSNLIKAEKVESKYIHFERRKGGGFYNQHYFLHARCDKIRKAEYLFVISLKNDAGSWEKYIIFASMTNKYSDLLISLGLWP